VWGRLIRAEDAEDRVYKSSERLKDAAEVAWRATFPGAGDLIAELAETKVGGWTGGCLHVLRVEKIG
jgi:hypothetical protein